jgi:hypothetical protein
MVGKVRSFGTPIWHAANRGAAREYLFVCPTGMECIDRRFVVDLPGNVIGNRELIA